MANDKFLFVVSGAAGTGKDSVVKALREAHPEIEKTVSATTRTPRPGEQEGVDYYYRSVEQFRQLIDTDQVVEHNFYNGNYSLMMVLPRLVGASNRTVPCAALGMILP